MIIYVPYTFRFVVDPISGRHRAFGQQGILPEVDQLLGYNIIDSEIKYINIMGKPIYNTQNQLNDDTYTPEQAIVQWANENEPISLNPYTREEFARQQSYYIRPLHRYVSPKAFNQTFLYIDHTNGREVEAQIPYVFRALTDIPNINGQCPVDNFYIPVVGKEQNSNLNINHIQKQKPIAKGQPKNKKINSFDLLQTIRDLEKQMLERIRDRIIPYWSQRDFQLKKIGQKAVVKSNLIFNPNNNNNQQITIDKLMMDHFEQRKKKISNVQEDFIVTYSNTDSSLIGYFIPSLKLGIIRIPTFLPQGIDDYQKSFYEIVRSFSDTNSEYKSKKILLDLRSNTGGYARLPPIVFQFLFPQADTPIWPPVDWVKAPVNSIRSKIMDSLIKESINDVEINVDEQTGKVIYDYYNQIGTQRTTSIDLSSGKLSSATVNLTKRGIYYSGHNDQIRNYSINWSSYFRSVHFQPKDVIALVNGICTGECANFAKAISQKKVGRTVALGNFGGVHNKARFDFGCSGGGNIIDNEYIEQIHNQFITNPTQFQRMGITNSDFPDPFYRQGSFISFQQMEHYGITSQTSDYLNEFYIQDADFHINLAAQYLDIYEEDEISDDLIYRRVILELNQKLGNQQQNENQNQQKNINNESDEQEDNEMGCAAGEVFTNTTGRISECKQYEDRDPHSFYGFKCSIEDTNARNYSTGEIMTGSFIKDTYGCLFSHCSAGYNRMNGKCVEAVLFPGDDVEYLRPDYLEQKEDPISETEPETDTEIIPETKQDDDPEPEEEQSYVMWIVISVVFIVVSIVLGIILYILIIFGILKGKIIKDKNKEEKLKHEREIDEQKQVLEQIKQQNQIIEMAEPEIEDAE